MKSIYVGNLDYNTGEEELQKIFETYGQVEKVNMIRDQYSGQPRGFAFVEMTNDEEAEKAIAAVNGMQVGSRNLTVNEARPKATRGGGGGERRFGGGGGGGGRGGRGGGRGGYGGGRGNRY
jgi:cold-inducible RNA-binding protein